MTETYTALARKWRPRAFAELIGQDHVRRALVNALETGRVHHAFLFTGTRGVGKTTVSRTVRTGTSSTSIDSAFASSGEGSCFSSTAIELTLSVACGAPPPAYAPCR